MSTRKSVFAKSYGGGAVSRIVKEDIARAAAASRNRRQASYALRRLIGATPGTGRSLMATGRSSLGVGEVKFFDVDVAGPAAGLLNVGSVTGAEPGVAFTGLTELNCVQQGASSYNRVGAKIMIKSIQVKTTLRLQGTTPVPDAIRFMVVYDRQPNGAFPLISDIISDNISTAPGFHSGVNMSNKDRFHIVRDQYRTLSPAGSTSVVLSEFIKTKLDVQFKASSGNIGDITTGALYFIVMALQTPSAATYVQMSDLHSRIRYYD